MKKIALGVLIALIAASPAVAAKKTKKQTQAQQAAAANPNDAGFRFVRDSIPIYLPTAVKVFMYPPGNNNK